MWVKTLIDQIEPNDATGATGEVGGWQFTDPEPSFAGQDAAIEMLTSIGELVARARFELLTDFVTPGALSAARSVIADAVGQLALVASALDEKMRHAAEPSNGVDLVQACFDLAAAQVRHADERGDRVKRNYWSGRLDGCRDALSALGVVR